MPLTKNENATTDNAKLSTATISDVEQTLNTSPDGLSQAEAQRRLEQYGYNELAEETANPLLKFLSYLWGPIPWMIEAAAILSGVVQHWADLGIILALLIVNAVVGFWEEYQAGTWGPEAAEALIAQDGRSWLMPEAGGEEK